MNWHACPTRVKLWGDIKSWQLYRQPQELATWPSCLLSPQQILRTRLSQPRLHLLKKGASHTLQCSLGRQFHDIAHAYSFLPEKFSHFSLASAPKPLLSLTGSPSASPGSVPRHVLFPLLCLATLSGFLIPLNPTYSPLGWGLLGHFYYIASLYTTRYLTPRCLWSEKMIYT